jgi:glucokinase
MITLGTGIGMGIIIDRKLHHGSHGLIEGGHMIIPTNLRSKNIDSLRSKTISICSESISGVNYVVCGCGQVDCVEAYASARNTAMRLFERDKKKLNNSNGDSSSEHAEPLSFGSKEVFERALRGDPDAVEVLEETADYLALLCLNISRLVDPSVIIFGGGMAQAGTGFIDKVQSNMKKLAW